MAHPWPESYAETVATAGGTSTAINLPLFIEAGDWLIVVACASLAGAFGWPEGWTQLDSIGGNNQHVIACRLADGTEGSTITVTHTDGSKFAAIVWRISGGDPEIVPEHSVAAAGDSTTPNPPSITPTGGEKDYLFLAVQAKDRTAGAVAAYPANYPLAMVGAGTGGGLDGSNVHVAGAARRLTAETEDPGAFTVGAVELWKAWTIAVHPGTDEGGGGGEEPGPGGESGPALNEFQRAFIRDGYVAKELIVDPLTGQTVDWGENGEPVLSEFQRASLRTRPVSKYNVIDAEVGGAKTWGEDEPPVLNEFQRAFSNRLIRSDRVIDPATGQAVEWGVGGGGGGGPSGISLVGTPSDTNTVSSTTTITAWRRPDVVAGDVMLVVIGFSDSTGVVTVPEGWTLVRRTNHGGTFDLGLNVYVKVAGEAEPESYTWSWAETVAVALVILAYRGVDNASPVDSAGGTASSQTITAPTITPGASGKRLVACFLHNNKGQITPPASMTELIEIAPESTSSVNADLCVADEVVVPLEATGTRAATTTGSSANNVGISLILNEASA